MFNKFVVENCKNNDTIYTYIKRIGMSENYVRSLRKKEGYIKLNGSIAFTNAPIKNNDMIELHKNPNTNNSIMQNTIPLDIVYEDDDLLIINKPSGMPSIPSRRHLNYNLAGAITNYMMQKDLSFIVRIINRLDKDTAGLVCVAKHSLISNLLNSNEYIQKTYYAICTGKVENVVIDKKIATTKNELGYNNQKREISPNGKTAITYVTPLAYDNENTLCKIKLKFGRTHQIRVHMASINHPLLGDSLYGKGCESIDHTALVCAEMDIFNPISNKQINIKANLPNDFINAFKTDISKIID